jgi:hypothetical protein
VDVVTGAYEHTIRMQAKGQDIRAVIELGRFPAIAVAVDMDGAWLQSMGLPMKPINVVVDVNGTVRYVGVRSDALKKLTTELLAEKADPAKKAKPRPTEADAKKN